MSINLTRRDFVGKTLPGVIGAATVLSGSLVFAEDKDAKNKTVRLGLIGVGGRGVGLAKILVEMPDVEIIAVCDINPERIKQVQAIVEKFKGNVPVGYSNGPTDYKNLLGRDDIDAVVIATPVDWHCRMAIDAMNAGKNVGSEVPAAYELDDLWALVDTKEKTGKHYMMLENYIYIRKLMMVMNMIRQGIFGDMYYAECAYIHDCRYLMFNADGSQTWRSEIHTKKIGNSYPTHSLGPISKMLGINDGDRLDKLVAMSGPSKLCHEYAVRKFGEDSEQAKIEYISRDMVTCTVKTKSGKLIRIDYDTQSPRPMDNYYLVQGNRGIYNSRHNGIYLESEGNASSSHNYVNDDEYLAKYDHSYWRKEEKDALKAGHGGGDYFVLKDFIQMVRMDKEPWIDVYDAATWSSVYTCSRESLMNNSVVEMPDFTRGKWEDPNWRENNLNPWVI